MNILILILALTASAFGGRFGNVGPIDQSPSNRRVEIQRKLGINVFNPDAYMNPDVYEGNRTRAKVADKIKELKLQYARFDMYWSYIEKSEGVFDPATLEKYDRMVKRLNRDGIEPVAILYQPPCWAVYSQDCQRLRTPLRRFHGEPEPSGWTQTQTRNYQENWFRSMPQDMDLWKKYVRFVVNRWSRPVAGPVPYPHGRIKFFEPVNEAETPYHMLNHFGMWPNTPIVVNGSVATQYLPSAANLILILQAASLVIHSESDAKIVGPAFASPPRFEGSLYQDWQDKFRETLSALSPKTSAQKILCKQRPVTTHSNCYWLDVISFHTYSTQNMNCRTNSFLNQGVLPLLVNSNYLNKAEVWMTEVGLKDQEGLEWHRNSCQQNAYRTQRTAFSNNSWHPNVISFLPEILVSPISPEVHKAAQLITLLSDSSVLPSWINVPFLYSSVDQDYGIMRNLTANHARVDSTKSLESLIRLRRSDTIYTCDQGRVCLLRDALARSSPVD